MLKDVLGFILLIGLSSMSWSQQPLGPEASEPGSGQYTGHEDQFVLSIPEDWFAYDQTRHITGSESAIGMVIFSAANLSEMIGSSDFSVDEQVEVMSKLDRGEIPNFFLDRVPATRGMDCKGFSKKATNRIFRMLRDDPMWQKGWVVVDDLSQVGTMPIGGCEGLHFQGSSTSPEGTQRVMDVRAASDGDVLYLFSVRADQPHYDENVGVYDAAVASTILTAIE